MPTRSRLLLSWLQENGSLTARLRRHCGDGFAVRLVRHGMARPYREEAQLLGLAEGRQALVREVVLQNGVVPLVLARTILPPDVLRGATCGLAALGDRPLGEVIFAKPGLRRENLEFCRVDDGGWTHFAQGLREDGQPVCGRRSLYELQEVKLLVAEFFLPTVMTLQEGSH